MGSKILHKGTPAHLATCQGTRILLSPVSTQIITWDSKTEYGGNGKTGECYLALGYGFARIKMLVSKVFTSIPSL